jgi:organic hydroperoxide reductase OsmC/OhrA
MHMRGGSERRFAVHLSHQGGYRFQSQASEDGILHGAEFVSDEPDPVGENAGPSTPALLASALGHCLSASLLEALRHAHLDVHGCETDAVAVVRPNPEGNPRIDYVDVTIRPRVGESSPRMQRCADVFENHCTVTQSVRQGVDVRVQVEYQIDVPSEQQAVPDQTAVRES